MKAPTNKTLVRDLQGVLAQLRHLYGHMVNGRVWDTTEAANGLLSPQIRKLERIVLSYNDPRVTDV